MVSILACFLAGFCFANRAWSAGLEQRGSYHDMSDCAGNLDTPFIWEVGLSSFYAALLLINNN
jgi:hypothetical protein